MKGSARWLLGIVTLSLLLLGGVFIWHRVTNPSDGARQDARVHLWSLEGIVVVPLTEQSGSFLRGDIVTAVEGRDAAEWVNVLFDPLVARPQVEFGRPLHYTVLHDGTLRDVLVLPERYSFAAALGSNWGVFLYALATLLVASFVFLRRPADTAPQLMFLIGISLAASTIVQFIGLEVRDVVGGLGFWAYSLAWSGLSLLAVCALLHLALVFPKPLPVVARHPRIVPMLYTAGFVLFASYLAVEWVFGTNPFSWLHAWQLGQNALFIAYLALALAAMAFNYHREGKNSSIRQQLSLVVFSLIVLSMSDILFVHLPELLIGRPLLDVNLLALIGILVPIFLAVAILRYRLFDIDVIINRALVYGALTAIIFTIYVTLVVFLGALFQTSNNWIVALMVTGLVAALFQPLRERVQRGVNRLMYGERDEPYAAMSKLGERLEATLAPDEVLPTIVETVAQALKVPYVAIELSDEVRVLRTEYPCGVLSPQSSALVTFPLVYQHETLGHLIVAPRTGEEKFSAADLRLLNDLARQAGVAAHSLQLTMDLQRLTADLQRSREHLVTAREEERRRLRRDLHDGLGPTLAALALNASTMRDLIGSDSDAATKMASELQIEIRAAVAEIRRLVYALRPPTLDELGLVGAIRELANESVGHLRGAKRAPQLSIHIDAPEAMPPLPAAVEVAAYRIAQEALTNVVRHAHARNCLICLALEGAQASELKLEICDDGIGLPDERRAGVGLRSMRERAEELGGNMLLESQKGTGTRVVAHLPISGEK